MRGHKQISDARMPRVKACPRIWLNLTNGIAWPLTHGEKQRNKEMPMLKDVSLLLIPVAKA